MLDIKSITLKTEEQIIANWGDKENVLVSVICIAYNHEFYIEDAIKSFLMQTTDFAFEILIHDDASTDNTINIIKQYQAMYPNIVKPIIQKENQFNQGHFKPGAYTAKFSQGEFLAWCEGDDYWIDNQKLQKQYQQLAETPHLNICFHSAYYLFQDNRLTLAALNSEKQQTFTIEQIIKGGGAFMPTASIFIRRSVIENLPDWYFSMPVGDYYLQILAANPKGALFLPEPMSVYRYMVNNSFTAKNAESIEKVLNFYKQFFISIDVCNKKEFDNKYVREFRYVRYKIIAAQLFKRGQFLPFFKKYYKNIFSMCFIYVLFLLCINKPFKSLMKK